MFTHHDVLTALADSLRPGTGGAAARYPRAVSDSRQVQQGDLFVALRGERVDGNDYVEAAIERGAAGALVARAPDQRGDRAIYVVDDTLAALQTLARWHWQQRPLPALEITGTVGKTSTKEVAARLFANRYRVLMSEGGLNGDIGLPLVLLRREPHHTFAVLELGMHYQGEIALQCRMAPPTYGIVTNIGFTHMERLGSQAAIVEAKRELVEHLPPDGAVALNGDDPLVMSMRPAARCRVFTYGLSDGCGVRATDVTSRGPEGLTFRLQHGGVSVAVRTPLAGRHNVYTCLATAAAALADGFTMDEVADALTRVENPLRLKFGRGPRGCLLIDDTYNASPASMAASLAVLAEQPVSGRRIAVLGDMLELGAVEEEQHRLLGGRAAAAADVLFAVGRRSRWTAEAARAAGMAAIHAFETKETLSAALLAEIRAGDAVLLKGSRGLELETVVAELRAGA